MSVHECKILKLRQFLIIFSKKILISVTMATLTRPKHIRLFIAANAAAADSWS